MKRSAAVTLFASLLAMGRFQAAPAQEMPARGGAANAETRYLAFQIFTDYSVDSNGAPALNSGLSDRIVPGTPAMRKYVLDIKTRIGSVGGGQTRLAVMLGPICFEQTDEQVADYIARAFDLALETGVAVGFHLDDSIFWSPAEGFAQRSEQRGGGRLGRHAEYGSAVGLGAGADGGPAADVFQ